MDYTIIHKIEYVVDKVVYTTIGYTTTIADINTINSDYESTLGAWIETNKNELEAEIPTKFISEFFDSTPYVYVARTKASKAEELSGIVMI